MKGLSIVLGVGAIASWVADLSHGDDSVWVWIGWILAISGVALFAVAKRADFRAETLAADGLAGTGAAGTKSRDTTAVKYTATEEFTLLDGDETSDDRTDRGPLPMDSGGFSGFIRDLLNPDVTDRPDPPAGSAIATLAPDGYAGRTRDRLDTLFRRVWSTKVAGVPQPAVVLTAIEPLAHGDARLTLRPQAPGVTIGDLQGRVPLVLQELRLRRSLGEAGRDFSTGLFWLDVTNSPADDNTGKPASLPDDEWD